MGLLSQRFEFVAQNWFHFHVVEYSVSGETFKVETGAVDSAAFHLDGGTLPTIAISPTVGTDFQRTVTLTGGTFGTILVITRHGETSGSVQSRH